MIVPAVLVRKKAWSNSQKGANVHVLVCTGRVGGLSTHQGYNIDLAGNEGAMDCIQCGQGYSNNKGGQ